jgi:small subunit ribosomal protein S20
MPNIKSVIKDVKRSELNHLRNQAAKSQIKTITKKAKSAIAAHKPAAEVEATVVAAISIIDRTHKRGIIHKNAAARRKSRLMKRFNAAKSAAA